MVIQLSGLSSNQYERLVSPADNPYLVIGISIQRIAPSLDASSPRALASDISEQDEFIHP